MMKAEYEKIINSAIFPGIQGGPLMHVIAAKAVAFQEALAPEFKKYAEQVAKNAKVLAETLVKRGLRIVSGRTESHVMLVRSEEHTSELQSLMRISYAVFCLNKKNTIYTIGDRSFS